MDARDVGAALARASRRRGEAEAATRRRLAAWDALAAAPPPPSALAALLAELERPELSVAGVPPELLEQGVEVTPLGRGEPGPESEPEAGALVAEAFWSQGLLARVPRGVRAALPLQAGAGADLRRRAAAERIVLRLEAGASLSFVEGCTESGAGGARWSLVDAALGPGARLTAASVQAWGPGATSAALKRARLEAGAALEWTDANLGAASIDKAIEVSGEGRVDVLCAGFAAAGQRQTLRLATPRGSLSRALTGGAVRVEGAGVETRRLAAAGRDAAHAFFEPVARRLPLEFSVEWTRLLDAQLQS